MVAKRCTVRHDQAPMMLERPLAEKSVRKIHKCAVAEWPSPKRGGKGPFRHLPEEVSEEAVVRVRLAAWLLGRGNALVYEEGMFVCWLSW